MVIVNGQHAAGRYERATTGELRYIAAPQGIRPTAEATDLRVRSDRYTLRDWQRALLATSAWALDTAAHLAAGTLTYVALDTGLTTQNAALIAAVTIWLSASFLHRVVIQRSTRATAAKALLGLHLENPDEQPITYWQLIKLWFMPLAFAQLLSS